MSANSKQHIHQTNMTTTNLAQYYRRKMAGSKDPLLENMTGPATDFSDDAMSNRADTSKEELYRIVRDYLDGKEEYYRLVDKIIENGGNALKAVACNDDKYLSRNPEKTSLLEVIVRTDGSRPSFMVRNGAVDKATSPPGTWGNLLDASADRLNEAIACVGRININDEHIGTGYLIHKNLILTNRHVLQAIATFENNGQWQLAPGARIDFGYEFRARQSINPRLLKRVVFCGSQYIDPHTIDHNKLDLALIELEPTAPENLPQRILSFFSGTEWPEANTNIFTIGYPGNPGLDGLRTYNTLLEQLFRSTYGCKRIAPGTVIPSAGQVNPWTIAHDATTLGGNSGSVIIVAGREYAAAGLHYGGTLKAPRENWGHNLGLTMSTTDASGRTLGDHLQEFEVAISDII